MTPAEIVTEAFEQARKVAIAICEHDGAPILGSVRCTIGHPDAVKPQMLQWQFYIPHPQEIMRDRLGTSGNSGDSNILKSKI